jgi:hypothetical protein
VRRLIQHFFPERECIALIRPVEREDDLRHLESVDKNSMRPEFLRQVEAMKSTVFSKCRLKQLNGTPVTGEMLLTLAESYVEAINKGLIPNIEGSWISLCKAECFKLVGTCADLYSS